MATVARSDIFGRVHKGLRKALFDLAIIAGRTDYTNDGDMARLKAQAAETIYFLRRHGHVEDTFQLPLVVGKSSDLPKRISHDHEIVEERIAALEASLARLDAIASAAERAEAGEAFYFQVNSFIASYLLHMELEETEVAPLFFQHCSDQELREMLASIVANNSPSDSMLMLRYTIPSIDRAERASFLGMIKQTAPPQAFENVMKLVETLLSEEDWQSLCQALELHETVA